MIGFYDNDTWHIDVAKLQTLIEQIYEKAVIEGDAEEATGVLGLFGKELWEMSK